MSNWYGFIGAFALVAGGASMYAPTAPEEPRPVVVAEAPPAPAPEAAKAPGEGAPQGG